MQSQSILKQLLGLFPEAILALVDFDLAHQSVFVHDTASPLGERRHLADHVVTTRGNADEFVKVYADVAELCEDILKFSEALGPQFTDGRHLHGNPVSDSTLVVALELMLEFSKHVIVEIFDSLNDVLMRGLLDRLFEVFDEVVALNESSVKASLQDIVQLLYYSIELFLQRFVYFIPQTWIETGDCVTNIRLDCIFHSIVVHVMKLLHLL